MRRFSKKDKSTRNQASTQSKTSTNTNTYSKPISAPPSPEPVTLRSIFQLRSAGYPWKKATNIALSMGIPLLVGAILDQFSIGLIATMGGLTATYANDDPYIKRALRLAMVVIGFALSMGLGILASGNPLWTAVTIGGVSMAAFFLCDAWRMPKPSGYLFTLVCAVGTSLPLPAADAPSIAGWIALGGCWAWLVSMAGVLVNPRGPEHEAVRNAYQEVAGYLAAIGTKDVDFSQHNATAALREAQEAVQTAEMRRTPRTGKTARLRRLIYQANALFLAGVELSAESSGTLTPKLPGVVRSLADTIHDPDRARSIWVPEPLKETAARKRVHQELQDTVSVAAAETYAPNQQTYLHKQSARSILKGAFSRHSLIVPTSLRIGITLVAATLIAAAIGNERPYWVPLTSAAVLNGATSLTIVHRTVQRAAGTAVGIFIGALLIAIQPSPYVTAFAIMGLQFCIQFAIIRNYGFGVTFITPLAILIAENSSLGVQSDNIVSARLLDTITGCVIGLIAMLLLWRRASSTRLPAVLGKLIREEERALQWLLTPPGERSNKHDKRLAKLRARVETSLMNVRTVYDTAAGEWGQKHKTLKSLWPAVVAARRIGYLIIAGSAYAPPAHLSSGERTSLQQTMQQLAGAAEGNHEPGSLHLPDIQALPAIEDELKALHNGLKAGRITELNA